MTDYHVGDLRIIKIPELDLNGFAATQLLPGLDADFAQRHPDWLQPDLYDAASGRVQMSVHSWLVRQGGRTILVDTGAGNEKSRPTMPVLDHLHQPFLERLADAGVAPADVDTILLTHIHADHVGWNTRREETAGGAAWVSTFPNATVMCSDLEWRYGAALATGDAAGIAGARMEAGMGEPVRTPAPGVFDDSMRPLEPAGRVRRVPVDGREVLPGVHFLPTPGHSIDHVAIAITSRGETALFGGDVLHHPFEIFDPDLVSMFCEFPEAARQSRRGMLERAAQDGVTYFSSHFPMSSAGRISRGRDGFSWKMF